MAYKVIILYQLYMPSYFLGTFTEYPYLTDLSFILSTAIVPAITDNNDTKQQAARLRAGIIRAKANTVPIPVTKPIFLFT